MQIGDGGMTRKVGNKQEDERKPTSNERVRVNRMAKRLFERVNTRTSTIRYRFLSSPLILYPSHLNKTLSQTQK